MMTRRSIKILGLVGVSLLLGYSAWPQAKKAQAAQKKPGRPVSVLIGLVTHNDGKGVGSGKDFTIIDGETTVKGDDAKWNQNTNVAEATGNLKMSDPQADATSTKAIIHYASAKRIVEMIGDVKITVRPKKKAEKATAARSGEESPRSQPAEITCDRVDYHYARDKKYAKLVGNFKIVQKLTDLTRNVTADHAEWFGNEDRILLHPPVYYETSKGQKMNTKEPVTLITTEGAETIQGRNWVMEFLVEDEEEEKPAAKPATPVKKP